MKTIATHSLLALLLPALFLVIGSKTMAQTNPLPYNLATGTYHFTSWDSISPAGTFPENMIFQFVPQNHIGPFYSDSASDYNCGYDMTKRPRVNGYMDKGVGILTTSSSQYNDCNSGSASQRYMGTALLSLNSAGRANIKVQWKSETLVPGDGNGSPTTPRIWNLRLQYRLGTSGNFTDIPGPVEFVSGLSTGDSITIGPTTLPNECNNAPVVQLRWIYFESSAGSGGTRPRLRLDDIAVQSDSYVGLDNFASARLEVFPNPAHEEFFIHCASIREGKIRITDNIGNVIREMPFNAADNKYDCAGLSAGLYFVNISDNYSGFSKVSKLVIR